MRIVGLVGGPERGGRTAAAVAAVLAGTGADTALVELSRADGRTVAAALDEADAVVFGSPVYRATYSALLKSVLEGTERGMWGESAAPLQGKAAATVLTGASGHHFLAMNDSACWPGSSRCRCWRPGSTSTTAATSTAAP